MSVDVLKRCGCGSFDHHMENLQRHKDCSFLLELAPLGVSLAKTFTQEYETNIYADELTDAESLAQEIIRENLVLKRDRPETA